MWSDQKMSTEKKRCMKIGEKRNKTYNAALDIHEKI